MMYGWKRLMAVSMVVAAVLAVAMAPASAAGARTRWVDRDGHAGPNGCNGSGHASLHIQTAVNASNADDTVIVCPGTYVEQVSIKGSRDGLTLKSSKPFGATIKAPHALVSAGGFNSLVTVDNVDNVTVRGFKVVTRTLAPCEDVGISIVVVGSRHAAIRGNRLLAPGASTPDCIQADGIAVADALQHADPDPRSSSATIGFNEVRDAVELGIVTFGDRRHVTADIVHNSVRAYFGEPPAGGQSVVTTGLSGGAGIAMVGRARGSVRDNAVQGASSAPLSGATFIYGIAAIAENGGSTSPFDNGPIDIHDNIVRRVEFGVVALEVDGVTIRSNRVTNATHGIDLAIAIGGSVRHNTVAAKSFGITVESSSTGNSLRNNTVSGNGGRCDDDSTGTGTANTANHWSGNTATHVGNPPGICAIAP